MSITGRMHAFLTGLKEAFITPQLPADKHTVLKEKDHRNPSVEKSCHTGDGISLDEMKRIKNKFAGATVNDIMLATLTMTIQSYFKEVGQDSVNIRGNFPLNLRDPKENVLQNSMGNRFVGGNFTFPIMEEDPVKIVLSIKSQIDTVKCSPAPAITNSVLGMLIPALVKGGDKKRKELLDMLLDVYGKVTVMLSNVPGPSAQVSFCKQPIDDIMFYAFVGIGGYFGIISYNGKVNVGISISKATAADSAKIAKHWAPAFKRLVESVDAASPEQLQAPRSHGDAICFSLVALVAALRLKMGYF